MSDGNNNITTGEILEVLNTKVDLDLSNVDNTSGADVVIEFQTPTAENGYTWYRKYKSGWVEQGGVGTLTNSGSTTNLIIEMANTNYFVSITKTTGSTDHSKAEFFISDRTTVSFTAKQYDTVNMVWEVKGMAA